MAKILLVEDNEMNRDMLSRRLLRNGYQVMLAVDGGEGLAMARELRSPALIFSNQIIFVYAIDKTSASTVTLFLGATPIFIGVLASLVGLERMGRGFWIATAVSLVGVGFVASGSGGSTAASGRTRVPVGSEIAQPQRAVP